MSYKALTSREISEQENKKLAIYASKHIELEYSYENIINDFDVSSFILKEPKADSNKKVVKFVPFEETQRTLYRRSKDRILYSGGFRRLQDKTQVMDAIGSGDHRTRLTHTLEVEQIATSIARSLKLNVDLCSAIAMGHDVGHTPFGHAAERALDKKTKDIGGFRHAVQSVKYYTEIKNVILPCEVFEGIIMHDTDINMDAEKLSGMENKTDNKKILNHIQQQMKTNKRSPFSSEFKFKNVPFLEAQVVYWADSIAYLTHDFEDWFDSPIYARQFKQDIKDDDMGENIAMETIELARCIMILTGVNDLDDYDVDKHILNNNDNDKPNSKEPYSNDQLKEYYNKAKDFLAGFETRDLIRNILDRLIESSEKNINEFLNAEVLDSEDDITNLEYLKELDTRYKGILNKFNNDYQVKLNDFNNRIKSNALKFEPGQDQDIKSLIKETHEAYMKLDDLNCKIRNLFIAYNTSRLNNEKKENESRSKNYKDIFMRSLVINLDQYPPKNESETRYLNDGYKKLQDFIYEKYIKSPEIQHSDAKAERIMNYLFTEYSKNIRLLPEHIYDRIEKDFNEIFPKKDKSNKMIIEQYIESKDILIDRDNERFTRIDDNGNLKCYTYNKLETYSFNCKSHIKDIIAKRHICDYLATMTDKYAKAKYNDFNSMIVN